MRYLILLVLIFASQSVCLAADLSGWKKLYTKKNLSFYSKKLKGSSLLNFRAVGEINVAMDEAMAILRSVKHATKWDENTRVKKTVENISDIEAITYSETGIPWPFRNRDLVLNNKLFIDTQRVALRVDVKSIERKDYPKRQKLVRAFLDAKMFFREKSKEVTLVDLQILVDPKGSIPHWVVNIVQKTMPYDFLIGLVKYSRKVDMKPNPGVAKLHQELKSLIKNTVDAGGKIPAF